MAFEEYQDILMLKERTYHRIDLSKATVIMMDCKDVTSDHQNFHLMSEHPIYQTMADCAGRIAVSEGLDCTIYAGIDELTVVFHQPQQLFDTFRVGDCADYIVALYTQRFLKIFWKTYPTVFIKTSIFSLPHTEVRRLIAYRKAICRSGALYYQAKEHLDKSIYHRDNGKDFTLEQISDILRIHGLYDELITNKSFYEGILLRYKIPSATEMIASMFSKGIAKAEKHDSVT